MTASSSRPERRWDVGALPTSRNPLTGFSGSRDDASATVCELLKRVGAQLGASLDRPDRLPYDGCCLVGLQAAYFLKTGRR